MPKEAFVMKFSNALFRKTKPFSQGMSPATIPILNLLNQCNISSTKKSEMMNEVQLLIVTGSSSGLGLATSKQLLERNFHVMGIDKDPPIIQNTAYTHLEMDLAQFDADLILNELTDGNWFGFIHCESLRGQLIPSIEDWNHSIGRECYLRNANLSNC